MPAAYALPAVLTVLDVDSGRHQIAMLAGVSFLMLASTLSMARHELQAKGRATRPEAFPDRCGGLPGRGAHLRLRRILGRGASDLADRDQHRGLPPSTPAARPSAVLPSPDQQLVHASPGDRTVLVSDSTQPLNPTLPAALGTPVKTVQIGQPTVYSFPYSIASKFGP